MLGWEGYKILALTRNKDISFMEMRKGLSSFPDKADRNEDLDMYIDIDMCKPPKLKSNENAS